MNNLLIAEQLHKLSKLLELHQENVFKVKAIANASSVIEKLNYDINETNYQALVSIKGIGKNILEKIHEILKYGKIKELEQLENMTPETVVELLNIRGFGASKVYKLWKDLHIENVEQLIEAAEKNELTKLKGITAKVQQSIFDNAKFYLQNKNKLQLGIAVSIANEVQKILNQYQITAEITGELRRHCEIVNNIEWITTQHITENIFQKVQQLSPIPVIFHHTEPHHYAYNLLKTTGSEHFLKDIQFYNLQSKEYSSEEEIFKTLNLEYIPPPQREHIKEYYSCNIISYTQNPIQIKDIKGILHCHTTYSDGLHSLKEMADYCKNEGFEYLGICDHSQTAKYANGLEPERVWQQFEEINQLNKHYSNFKILKGIESDIMKNGELDYDEDLLKQFDFIVASIHNHFEMTEQEATQRIIKAIENPYTSILGHLTGRLLLIRKGYPLNHKKIIDACAANNVVIELNANTYRLDIDWRWLKYCMEKNVKIAINPDAHSTSAIYDTIYGVMTAQKAGVTKDMVINTYSLEKIKKYLIKNKSIV